MNAPNRRLTGPIDPRGPRLGLILATASIVLIGTVTWTPTEDPVIDQVACLICGERGLADFLLNIPFFIPLGIGIGLLRWPIRTAIMGAVLTSAVVELGQLFIPGRDASLSDILANGLGAVLGLGLARTWRVWVLPNRKTSNRLAATIQLAAVVVFSLTAYLFVPHYPGSEYWGQWTPRLTHLGHYRGRVIDARLNGGRLPGTRLANPEDLRRSLERRFTLEIDVVAGDPAPKLSPILRIVQERWSEILLVGADRNDLVFRHQIKAVPWTLDRPDLRIPDAMRGIPPGDTVRVVVEYDGKEYCARVDAVGTCGLGHSVGRGWTLLLYPEHLPSLIGSVLNAAWVAMFVAAFAYYVRDRRLAIGGFIAIGVTLALTSLAPAMFTPLAEWLAAAAGGVGGAGLGRGVRRWAGNLGEAKRSAVTIALPTS